MSRITESEPLEEAPSELTAREQNRRARHERREEILLRWNGRVAVRLFEREVSPKMTVDDLIDTILHYAQWAEIADLVRAAAEIVCGPEVVDNRRVAFSTTLCVRLLRLVQLKEMSYSDYLNTREWRSRADAAKRVYGGQCALDADHIAEHAHHRTYERRGRERHTDLVALCADCHAKFHGRRAR